MKYAYDEQKRILTISLEGRIDSGNAAALQKEITQIRSARPDGQIVFDLDRLNYISSAGLRVFLKLARREKSTIRAVNVSTDVVEIFRMTGFDDILEISQRMRRVSVQGCEVIGRGANGVVYRLDPDTIIKVFRPDAGLSIVERERERARAALLKGLPTAIAYDVVKAGDCYGIVYEMINSRSLAQVLQEDEAHFERYAKAYASLFKEIHNTQGDLQIFGRVKEIYEEAIDYCSDVYTAEELEKLRTLIRSVPDRTTLIHGDFHPKNIMLIDGELTLIDMGDMSLGDPVFDFLATAATQVNLVKLDPVFAQAFTGMPVLTVTRLWNTLLEEYFAGESRERIDQIDRRIAGLSKLKVALAPYFAREIDKTVIRASIEDARKNLFPIVDQLIE